MEPSPARAKKDVFQGRCRNCVEWIAGKPNSGKELPAEETPKSTSDQWF